MKAFLIKKRVQAKNIKDALKRESEAELVSIEVEEKDEPNVNTHAIGFQIPYQPDLESYDPSP